MAPGIFLSLVLTLGSGAPLWASDAAIELAIPETFSAPTAASRWDDILSGSGSKITFGISLRGPSPYTRNNDAPFIPASNSKLFTAGAVLADFGAAAVFKTELRWQDAVDGDTSQITALTITGSGDPTWGLSIFGEKLTSRADAFADALFSAGVRKVHGTIAVVADDLRWNTLTYPKGWAEWARTECGTAQAQAFNLNLNCATYVVTDAQNGHWSQPGVPIAVKLAVKAGKRTQLDVEALDDAGKVSTSFLITGTLKPGARPQTFKLPVHNTAGWLQNLIVAALHRKGIVTSSKVVTPGAVHVRIFTSPAFAEIFKPFLKHSINMIGEAFFKALGSKFGPANLDLVEAAQDVLRNFVGDLGSTAAQSLGIEARPGFYANEAKIFDGSGISRESEVTTSTLMALLLDLRARTDFSIVWNALPIAGVDGTLQGRMKGTAAAGVLRGKTGTLNGVYNLSGYVPRLAADGNVAEYVPFVMLTRTTVDEADAAHAAEDRLGAELARLINSGSDSPGMLFAIKRPLGVHGR